MTLSRSMTGLLLVLVQIACLSVLTGCPDKKQPPQPAPPPPRVGVSLSGLDPDQDQAIRQAMDARKNGVDLLFAGAGGDATRQEAAVDRMIGEKVAAVVLEAVDQVAARNLVERLARHRIKVVALNVLPADTPVDAYVGFDRNLARTLLIRAAAGKGTPCLILTVAGLDRPGLWTALAGASGLPGEAREYSRTDVLACAAGRASLLKKADRPAVILAGDPALAVAAVRDLEAVGAPPAFAGGIGNSREAFRYVNEGRLTGEVDTRPEEEGLLALQAALSLARGQPVARHELAANGNYSVPAQIVPVRLITRQNFYLLEKTWSGQEGAGGGGQPGSGEQTGNSGPSGGNGQQGNGDNVLRLTTEEGRIIEVHYRGRLKKIESSEAGKQESRAGGATG